MLVGRGIPRRKMLGLLPSRPWRWSGYRDLGSSLREPQRLVYEPRRPGRVSRDPVPPDGQRRGLRHLVGGIGADPGILDAAFAKSAHQEVLGVLGIRYYIHQVIVATAAEVEMGREARRRWE